MINANFQENTWSKKTPLWDNGVHKENVKELLHGLINVFKKYVLIIEFIWVQVDIELTVPI